MFLVLFRERQASGRSVSRYGPRLGIPPPLTGRGALLSIFALNGNGRRASRRSLSVARRGARWGRALGLAGPRAAFLVGSGVCAISGMGIMSGEMKS